MNTDPVNLTDRRSLFGQLEQLVHGCQAESKKLALLLININHFRQFNIANGYQVGDRLLAEFLRRLDSLSREQDVIGRIGNSEFVLILPEVFNEGHATLAAIKVLKDLNQPFKLGNSSINVTAGIGIAMFPDHATDFHELVQKAEIALIDARNNLQAYSIYSTDSSQAESNSWDIESELQNAIDKDQFELYFQPQVYLKTGQLFGAEALIRWKNGDGGFVRPDIFIPIAEQSGHIYEITKWTISAAIWAIKNWPIKDMPIRVAVNLSTKVLGEPGLVESVIGAIGVHGLNFEQLTLEITESALVEDMSSSFKSLEEFKSLGVNIFDAFCHYFKIKSLGHFYDGFDNMLVH